MDSFKQILPGLFRVTQTIHRRQGRFSVNIFLIAGKDGIAFDSGYGTRQSQDFLVQKIMDISNQKKISITRAICSHSHWDHFSGLNHLQKKLGLQILATAEQAAVISSKKEFRKSLWSESSLLKHLEPVHTTVFKSLKKQMSDTLFLSLLKVRFVQGPIKIVDDHSQFIIDNEPWQMIPVPGHCSDDIVLYNQARGILLGGDIVLNKITTWLGPPRSNLEAYINSLEQLKALPNLQLILPAHGRAITEPVKRIQSAIDHRHGRTRKVFDMICEAGQTGMTFGCLFHQFYPKVSFMKKKLLGGWIGVTLEFLVEKNKIRVMRKNGKVVFSVVQ